MTILIATGNQDIVLKYFKAAKFTPSTAHTCTFKVSRPKFEKMVTAITADGYNRYALFSW